MQPNNGGKKAKGGWVLWNSFFWGFVLWWVLFFPSCFCQAHFFFNHQEFVYYLQIKKNRRFLSQSEQFCHGLGF
jgi:hypothetical protein